VRSERPVAVDIAVRRDREWQAMAETITLPVLDVLGLTCPEYADQER
jgi:hypothetical protein